MGFLVPLFFAGAALIVVPWLVHQIRRPQRKLVRFSSLMFVPNIKRDVVERKKIQHPWLMLLRMLMLVLLALAFSRPYWTAPATAAEVRRTASRQVILLDTSYSMGVGDHFEKAKAAALELIDDAGREDRIGVVLFGGAAKIAAPLESEGDPEAGSAAGARAAVEAAQLGFESTNYVNALQTAERMLIPSEETVDATIRLTVHVISDLQQAGMPREAPAWKLSPRIELNAVEIGNADAKNLAVTDLSVEEIKADELRVRAKVKNWTTETIANTPIQLIAGGLAHETKEVRLDAGNASQVIFTVPKPDRQPLEGTLQLGSDALAADNQYFFAWNPRPKHPVLLVSEPTEGAQWPAARFIELAIPDEPGMPWSLRESPAIRMNEALTSATQPEIVVVLSPELLDAEAGTALLSFVQEGGNALIVLNERVDAGVLNRGLLQPLGLEAAGPRYEAVRETRFETFAWVDLEHAIFTPFQGSPYNDFTPIHFFNYQKVRVISPEAESAPRAIARFDDELPAMLETRHGKGRVILWTFALDLKTTNFPQRGAFVPLLHETLSHLTRSTGTSFNHLVAETAMPPAAETAGDALQVKHPGESEWTAYDPAGPPLAPARPGFLYWQSKARAQVDAVNVDPREGDLQRISADELKLRLCSAPALEGEEGSPAAASAPASTENLIIKHEVGRNVLILFLIFLGIETLYAAWLAARGDSAQAEAT